MSTVRAITRQRREKMLQMRRGAFGLAEDQLPLKRQVVHKICTGVYGFQCCACEKAPDKPACDRIEGIAQHIIDLIRRYDLRKQKV
jgi:hypothetical protein